MANDRGILTHLRRGLDKILGEGMAHTLLYRWPETWRLRREHFCEGLNPRAQRDLFARSVRLVEIETHSYCNRICWFCPNAQIDRRTTRHYLPTEIFRQILADLRDIHYAGRVSFSRYNEPFGDEIIFERFRETRAALPKARLLVFSNGDFLTREKLDRSAALGIDELQIGVYLPNGADWTAMRAEFFLQRTAKRLALQLFKRREAEGERITYGARIRRLRIQLFCPNYARYGSDRGGSVAGVPAVARPRISPCLYPVTDIYIDYNGQVMPCCHLRSDVPAHQQSTLGRLQATPGSIFQVWAGATAAQWRGSLCEFSEKSGPCSSCTARLWADTRAARWLLRAQPHVRSNKKALPPFGKSLPVLPSRAGPSNPEAA